MMTYLKHVGRKKHSDLKTKTFEEIQVLYERLKRQDQNFIAIRFAKYERQIKDLNKDPKKKRVIKETLREEDTTKVPAGQEVIEQGIKKRKSGHVKMLARKRQRPQLDDDSDDEHIKCLRIITFDSTIDSEIIEIKSFITRLHKVSSPDGNYLVVYRVNGHFRAFNYLMEKRMIKVISRIINKNGRLYKACGVCILELKDKTIIYMLVERKYPLSKELLQQMLDLGLEVEEESTTALQLHWLVQKQTSFGKDKTNPLIVGSLLKTTRQSIHIVVYNKELAIPEQTANGKGISNPLMAGSLPKNYKANLVRCCCVAEKTCC
ncbi:hypothetical protein Tco_0363261 [Tanacetum coccineum]